MSEHYFAKVTSLREKRTSPMEWIEKALLEMYSNIKK